MRRSNIVKRILCALEYGIAVTTIGFSRGSLRHKEYLLGRVLEQFDHEPDERNKMRQNLTRLYRKREIAFLKKDNRYIITLTESGKRRLLSYSLQELAVAPQKTWDGIWRVIIFDIPEKEKSARDSMRFYLKRAGFVQIQDSVFVTPYPCRNEVDFLVEYHSIQPYVRMIEANVIDGANELKDYFNLF